MIKTDEKLNVLCLENITVGWKQPHNEPMASRFYAAEWHLICLQALGMFSWFSHQGDLGVDMPILILQLTVYGSLNALIILIDSKPSPLSAILVLKLNILVALAIMPFL